MSNLSDNSRSLSKSIEYSIDEGNSFQSSKNNSRILTAIFEIGGNSSPTNKKKRATIAIDLTEDLLDVKHDGPGKEAQPTQKSWDSSKPTEDGRVTKNLVERLIIVDRGIVVLSLVCLGLGMIAVSYDLLS